MTRTLEEVTKEHVLSTLEELDWNYLQVAKALGVDRRTLYRMSNRYSIVRPPEQTAVEIAKALDTLSADLRNVLDHWLSGQPRVDYMSRRRQGALLHAEGVKRGWLQAVAQ